MTFPDTIVAISTPPGIGGIAVLRLSGKDSWPSALQISNLKLQTSNLEPNTLHFARIYKDRELVDEVVLSFFKGPKSFTSEDVVEISCHGGRYAANRILELLLKKNIRHARPGEFTERAFLNGKMDLAQAEAVADLIHAKTHRSGQAAARQLAGGLSAMLSEHRTKLLDLLALIELELDFSEENIEFQTIIERVAILDELVKHLDSLIATFRQGRLVREGLRIVIIGAPNAGKSTLLNSLVGHSRAIVSHEPGTTRDVVEARIELSGIEVILQDTAGVRETTEAIESEGIARTKQALAQSDAVLLIVDSSAPLWPDTETMSIAETKRLFLLKNKSDLHKYVDDVKVLNPEVELEISALTGMGTNELKQLLIDKLVGEEFGQAEIIVAEQRHHDAIFRAKECINRAKTEIKQPTLAASDLRDAVNCLGEITGETVGEEILDRIFSKFCIGK